jgi:PAS domain S-box-containing protein
MSPQVTTLLGYTPEEWIADAGDVAAPDPPRRPARALAENTRHNETGEPFRLEYRMFAKDGRVVWVHDEATMVATSAGCRSTRTA